MHSCLLFSVCACGRSNPRTLSLVLPHLTCPPDHSRRCSSTGSAPEPLRRRYYDDHGHERARELSSPKIGCRPTSLSIPCVHACVRVPFFYFFVDPRIMSGLTPCAPMCLLLLLAIAAGPCESLVAAIKHTKEECVAGSRRQGGGWTIEEVGGRAFFCVRLLVA